MQAIPGFSRISQINDHDNVPKWAICFISFFTNLVEISFQLWPEWRFSNARIVQQSTPYPKSSKCKCPLRNRIENQLISIQIIKVKNVLTKSYRNQSILIQIIKSIQIHSNSFKNCICGTNFTKCKSFARIVQPK